MLSAELHAIELSPIVWPMNEVGVGDLGVLEQEDVIDQSAKITVKRNARRILVIATNHEKLSEACQKKNLGGYRSTTRNLRRFTRTNLVVYSIRKHI